MADEQNINDILHEIDDSLYIFTSNVVLNPWDIPGEVERIFTEGFFKVFSKRPSNEDIVKFQSDLTVFSALGSIKSFFENIMTNMLSKIREYASGGSYEGLSDLKTPSGITASSISGRMLNGKREDYHFEIWADVHTGHYRYIHEGLPRDWDAILQAIPVSMSNGKVLGKFLHIDPENVRIGTTNKGKPGSGIVRMLENAQGEPTQVFQMMKMKNISPNPFIPFIMNSEWQQKYSGLYQQEIIGQTGRITSVVEGYLNKIRGKAT